MRWLLAKDLRILLRSRLLLGLLIIYPIAIALLIGLAISRSPGKPKVAIVNLSLPGQEIEIGNNRLDISHYTASLMDKVSPVVLSSRAQAVNAVSSGKVLAALVLPADFTQRLSSVLTQARVEVLYNGNALEQSLVRSTVDSALAEANLVLADEIKQLAAEDIDLLLKGGNFHILGSEREILGLSRIAAVLHAIVRKQPPGATRAKLARVASFADFAAQNLDLSKQVLTTVSQPIQVSATLLHGRRTPLDAYAVVVAVSISLMFLAVLLAAAGIALEREEHTLARLIRGPPGLPALLSREKMVLEKVIFAAACAVIVAFSMLAGISAFISLEWGRAALWLVALVVGAAAFAALGVAIGTLAREVRAASLLSFALALPLAFLALVPAGAVTSGLYDVIQVISFIFPFKACLQGLDCAVNRASPGLGVSLAHLLGIAVGYSLLARLALRRTA
ncbi:MAG TPA: ABC transporter permease [Solirubrobacteraceae bacterium]|jgi:ABC-2 type transport system permease protein